MPHLPDEAFVVRGGLNTIELLESGNGVSLDPIGNLYGLSVNSAPGKTVAQLSESIPNGRVGMTTVGAVRSVGGDVLSDPIVSNPDHCLLSGIPAQTIHRLLTPTVPNPNRVKPG